ncbi:MAG: CBS domain-containing protein [Alphaproteobacteria bacterium]|nr:CBS domain-containing protein [Alphaproteobacteria bacterium]
MFKFLEQTTDRYMTRGVKTVARDCDMNELSEMFERDDYNGYPVAEDGQVVGIVTKFDILKCFSFSPSQMVPHYHELMSRRVGDVMTPEFIYVRPDTRLTRVLQLMVEHRLRSLIVLDDAEKLVGIIAREDVIHALKTTGKE